MSTSSARATILLSIAASAAAILVVYFTAGTAIEREIVERQTKMVVRSLLFNISVPQNVVSAVRGALPATDKSADDRAAASNVAVRARALWSVGLLLLIAYFVAKSWAGPRFPSVRRAAAVSGGLAAATELAFLLLVVRNFDSADPNVVRLQILKQLQN